METTGPWKIFNRLTGGNICPCDPTPLAYRYHGMISGLTESLIRERTSADSFTRGLRYYESDSVLSVVQRGNEIVAKVEGSDYEPYRVKVTVGEAGIAGATCSCPYEWGGWCKHIVAVLLACLRDRGVVEQRPSLDSRLEELSREQLIALVQQMIERHDDLELLIELAVSVPGHSLDVDRIRTQIRRAFERIGYDRRGSIDAVTALEHIMETGDEYVDQGAWSNAAAVYRVVLESIMDDCETMYDQEGQVAEVASECVEKLGVCLVQIDDAVEREEIFRALFETYVSDVDLGGYGISDAAPETMLERSTPEERRMMAKWAHEALSAGDPVEDHHSRGWRWEQIGGLILDLERGELDDETYLERCRETGRSGDLIVRLLELGRTDEAVEESAQVGDRQLLALADVFEEHAQTDRLEAVVRERLQEGERWLFLPWLKDRAEDRGDDEEALHFSELMFWERPSVNGYEEVRRLAQKKGRWEELRAAVIDRLVREEAYQLLTQLCVFEADIPQAIQWLERARQSKTRRFGGWPFDSTSQLVLQVARAAEGNHPLEAVWLYLQAAGELIDERGRDNYAMASRHLAHVRDIYLRLGRPDDWAQAIAEVRDMYNNLPAFKDELKKAGL